MSQPGQISVHLIDGTMVLYDLTNFRRVTFDVRMGPANEKLDWQRTLDTLMAKLEGDKPDVQQVNNLGTASWAASGSLLKGADRQGVFALAFWLGANLERLRAKKGLTVTMTQESVSTEEMRRALEDKTGRGGREPQPPEPEAPEESESA